MIIDAHTHIGHKIIVADADKMISSMDEAGIDYSLVFAGHINELPTKRLLEDIAGHRDRLLPVGVVSPLWPRDSLGELETIDGEGLGEDRRLPGRRFLLPDHRQPDGSSDLRQFDRG